MWQFDPDRTGNTSGSVAAMGNVISDELRVVCLAGQAWLFEHDTPGQHAEMIDSTIDRGALAAAIDKLTLNPGSEAASPAKVFVVQQYTQDGYVDEVIGVFATRDAAVLAAANVAKDDQHWDCEVIELDLGC